MTESQAILIAAIIAAVSSLMTVAITVISTMANSKFAAKNQKMSDDKSALLQSVTSNRMDWLSTVRQLMCEFCDTFRANPKDIDTLSSIRTKFLLYMRVDNEFYQPLLELTKQCCKSPIPLEQQESMYKQLILASQYAFASVWIRVKIEGSDGLTNESEIDDLVRKKTTPIRVLLDFSTVSGDFSSLI